MAGGPAGLRLTAVGRYEAEDHADVFVPHSIGERAVDLGEDPELFARTLIEWAATLGPA